MSENKSPSRRNFLQTTGAVAAATSLAAGAARTVHAAGDEKIKVALVGCGGRGTGAATNALKVPGKHTQLVAMADVFERKLGASYNALRNRFGDELQVTDDKKFIGFDAYRHAMDALSPGDVVILTTPPAFRWVQFTYAIEKGLNVFMEKPVTVDGPSSRKMLSLNHKAKEKNLKVGVGLMCRHCVARQALYEKIQEGALGDITMLRAYRMAGPTGSAATGPKPENLSELMYQIDRFHAFLWLSGGAFSDFLIHNIDESCWMKGAFDSPKEWPVEAQASGGRHYRGTKIDQNFDSYSTEYTFADGAKLLLNGRTIPGCKNEFASYAHGTKGCAVISTSGHIPAKTRIYKGQSFTESNLVWQYEETEPNPYQLEWNHLIEAIREDKPHNEVDRGVMASVVTSMGRMAAHTGQVITFEHMLNCEHEFAPEVDKLTLDGPAPLQAVDGKYPIPMPGLVTETEYETE